MQRNGILALASMAAMAFALFVWTRPDGWNPARPDADMPATDAVSPNPGETAGGKLPPKRGRPSASGVSETPFAEFQSRVKRRRAAGAPMKRHRFPRLPSSAARVAPDGSVSRRDERIALPPAADSPDAAFDEGATREDDESNWDEPKDDVLLSMPFRDGLYPEVGGTGLQVDRVASGLDGAEFSEESRLSLLAEGHVQAAAGTIALDVTAAWGAGDSSNQSLVTIRSADAPGPALELAKNATGLILMVPDSEGVPQYVRFPLNEWSNSDPHSVTATWDVETASVALYVDGEFIGTAPYGGFAIDDKTLLHIGSDNEGGWPALRGTLGSVTVLNKALGPEEVAGQ